MYSWSLTFSGLTPSLEQTQKSFRGTSWACPWVPCPYLSSQVSQRDPTFRKEHHPSLTRGSLSKNTDQSFCGYSTLQHSRLFQKVEHWILGSQVIVESLILENHMSWRVPWSLGKPPLQEASEKAKETMADISCFANIHTLPDVSETACYGEIMWKYMTKRLWLEVIDTSLGPRQIKALVLHCSCLSFCLGYLDDIIA